MTPQDEGPAGTVGFFVRIDGKEVPRYLIPPAGEVGGHVRMHLRDLSLGAGTEVKVAVRAVDGAGNVGPAAEATVKVSDRQAAPLPGQAPAPFTGAAALPRLGDAEVAVIDELDKVQPVTGDMIPTQADGYLAANHLWDAKTKEVRLHAARNEFVGFQVLLHGTAKGVRPTLVFEGDDKVRATFGRYYAIPDTKKGPLPDPIVPLDAAAADDPAGDEVRQPLRRGLRPARGGRRPPPWQADPRSRRPGADARRGAYRLELYPAGLSQFPAGDELLRPAGQRARLLPAGP